MRRTISIICTFILCLSFFGFGIVAEENTFVINNVKDWNKLAKECELDSYSDDLIVELNTDITFEDDFNPIPYFNGEFKGNHHKITNIVINSSQINDGLFRITGRKSNIHDLYVEYLGDNDSKRFGFVGYNQGDLTNISVLANVNGNNEVGILVGLNAVMGLIKECNVKGTIQGKLYVGGLVGKNYGIIKNSSNSALVNAEVVEEKVDITTVTVSKFINNENLSNISDIGGIAGTSFGTIDNCTNYSDIGHEHIGYNIGGIAGSQSGYIKSCDNNGKIFGRKEVGGIVGQFEPSMRVVNERDYTGEMRSEIEDMKDSSSELLDAVESLGEQNTDSINGVVENLNQAYDSLEIMLDGKLGNEEKYNNAKTAFSSSMRDTFSKLEYITQYNKDNGQDVTDSVSVLNDNVNDFGSTFVDFVDVLTNEKDVYVDISNRETTETDGVLISCINKGGVEGDINVGGIVGSIAVENDSDPEDDLNINATSLYDFTYEVRAILGDSFNYGTIRAKRSSSGGICGMETLGNIRDSINYGFVDSEDADYVGGIVGLSSSYLQRNYSKCFIYGNNYVGGISGSTIKGENNGSLSQIMKSNSNQGAVFGNFGDIDNDLVEKADEIVDNWYLIDDIAAIDGISYDSKAYRITDEEFLDMELDPSLRKVDVLFVDDLDVIFKKTLDYGESMSLEDVPDSVISGDEYRHWDNFDEKLLKNIKNDILFTCSYYDVHPTISSGEEPLAYVILSGEFSENNKVSVSVIEDKPVDDTFKSISYRVSVNLSESSSADKYYIYANGYENYDVYLKNENKWNKVDYETDGSRYLSIPFESNDIEISIVKKESNTTKIIIVSSAAFLLLILIVILRKKSKNKNK